MTACGRTGGPTEVSPTRFLFGFSLACAMMMAAPGKSMAARRRLPAGRRGARAGVGASPRFAVPGDACAAAGLEEAVVDTAWTYPRSTSARPRLAWWSHRCRSHTGRARPPAAGCPWPPAPPATPRGRPAAARPAPPPAPRAPRSARDGDGDGDSRGRVSGAWRPTRTSLLGVPPLPPRRPRPCSHSA